MKLKSVILSVLTLLSTSALCQTDNEKLALVISAAEDANLQKLKAFTWKRKSDVAVGGVVKLTTITEFSFDAQGKIQAKMIDAESSVKQKPGLRGRAQKSAIEDKAEYVQKALELSVAYTFMTKGQLMDFFAKATLSESNGVIEAQGSDIYVKGDKLSIRIDKATNLFIAKKFSSLLGKDVVAGVINYEKFDSGVSHGSTTVLDLPAQKMTINSANQDYTQRVK